MGLNNMAIKIKSIKDLEKIVKQDIVNKLNEERSQNKIKDVNRMNISEKVYSVYEPQVYDRRADEGGLTDTDNIDVFASATSTGVKLTISNNTPPKGFDVPGQEYEFLAPIVEYGTGGKSAWQKPRPFMKGTVDDLRDGRLLKRIIKEIKYIK